MIISQPRCPIIKIADWVSRRARKFWIVLKMADWLMIYC